MKRLSILLPSLAVGLCLVFILLSRLGPASGAAAQPGGEGLTQAQIIEALKKASTGNLADAIETATGRAGFMTHDMKPIFRAKVVGPAATALLRPILTTDKRKYPNYHLQVLDEAPAGSVLVYVLENGLHVSGIGNLMATTATVRGLAGAVIDGAARDIEEIERIGFPVYSRAVSPATVVGRYVSVSMQEPVICAGVPVRPGDYIVGGQRWRSGRARRQGRGCAGPDQGIRREGERNDPLDQGDQVHAQGPGQVRPVLRCLAF